MATFAIYIEDLADGTFEVHACLEKGRPDPTSPAEKAMRVGVRAIEQWAVEVQPREGTVIDLRSIRNRKGKST